MRFINGIVRLAPVMVLASACNQQPSGSPPSQNSSQPPAASKTKAERGNYLVTAIAGCDDCHTPKIFKPTGPEPDMTRRLAGYPASEKLPSIPPSLIAP